MLQVRNKTTCKLKKQQKIERINMGNTCCKKGEMAFSTQANKEKHEK
jgi:hypothetical protein